MSFEFLPDVAIADVAFRASGRSLAELFESAGMAVTETMTDASKLKPKVERKIELRNDKVDGLLFDFLQELVYLKDVKQLLVGHFSVIIEEDGGYRLTAQLAGEKINQKKMELRADVKAVTLHMFEVKKVGRLWTATVVLDI